MGRPRKSIEELKASGSYRPSVHDKRREAARGTVPGDGPVHVEIPKYFSPETRKEFLTTYNYLNNSGILTQPECTSLISCFDLYEESCRLRRAMQGLNVGDQDYRGVFSMYNTAIINFNKLIRGFGMVPADREKVSDLKTKKKKDESIMDLLKAPATKKK